MQKKTQFSLSEASIKQGTDRSSAASGLVEATNLLAQLATGEMAVLRDGQIASHRSGASDQGWVGFV